MFISWRQRAVKGGRSSLFLIDDPEYANSDARTPWKPLRCGHRGPGRVAWAPFLIQAQRRDGKPRQEILHRFPTIRTCCIKDPFNRAAWWYDVEKTIHGWWEADIAPMSELLARDRRAVVSKLRAVVPRASKDGVARFSAYRIEKETAFKEEWEPIYDEFYARHGHRFGGDAGGRGSGSTRASSTGAGSRDPDFALLGLDAGATWDEVRRRFRELALKLHPDAGGSDAAFVQLKNAYDRLGHWFRGQA